MSDPVIKVESMSKLYNLGELHRRTNSFREMVSGVFRRNGDEKKNETIWALKDVSFEVKRGDVLGIIGRNGAGKSTLLKILSRITRPTEGTASLNGRVGSLLEVGTGFHAELTGRENIFLNGAILGMRRREIKEKFDEIVDFAEVGQFIDTPVKRYSSGMYVRLAFAVAAHLEPEILLVDEVLAVGDVSFQRKCLGKMGDVAKGGRTVLFVSHNMAAVENLCSSGLFIDGGMPKHYGDIRDCIEKYVGTLLQSADTDFSKREDRSGDGRIKIRSFQIINMDNAPVEIVRTGMDYIFRFEFESRQKHVKDIDFAFTVRDAANRILFRNRTVESGIEIPKKFPEHGFLDCIIPKIPLTVGSYAFGFRLVVNGLESDYIKGGYAAHFRVSEGDFFGTGKITAFAPLIVPHEWKINQANG